MGKVFRDPLYDYIELTDDPCALEIISTPIFQRLRRVHQLGVSHYTYPGAQHDRLSHSLGVYHLARLATESLLRQNSEDRVKRGSQVVMAVALLHDVGHGPFSHLVEACLNVDHEIWTCRIIESEDHGIKSILDNHYISSEEVVGLIRGEVKPSRRWMKTLVSSQLDVDRLDYLRRDSLMSGAGYGRFDFHRLLHTAELIDQEDGIDLVWPSKKSLYAIEEYIFSRYYMYQNVYMHKTTRGMEVLLREMWKIGKAAYSAGEEIGLVDEIRAFWGKDEPSIDDYLAIEEFTLLQQMSQWRNGDHPVLSDLARRFLDRDHLVAIEAPTHQGILSDSDEALENRLLQVARAKGFPAEHYVLRDEIKAKYRQPYFAPAAGDELTSANAIRVLKDGELVEVSSLLPRLQPVTRPVESTVRFYVPRKVRDAFETAS